MQLVLYCFVFKVRAAVYMPVTSLKASSLGIENISSLKSGDLVFINVIYPVDSPGTFKNALGIT